ncbi:hypothetical protein [Fodinibius sediminis]|uniref:4-amino-4-deoxy-L-arabinose transferase n=1 Tax=Fodinibius sediminis TaxID=1214077 RepID=A0A521CLN8_9BACT|nr:hypothetical protein [Fodinibius sediminis]SMO60377.1 hypothetical protein SAMN06265218_106188 [Fodinibius sediminis]
MIHLFTADLLFAQFRLLFWGYILFSLLPRAFRLSSDSPWIGQRVLVYWGFIGSMILPIVIGLALFRLYDLAGILITLLAIIATVQVVGRKRAGCDKGRGEPASGAHGKPKGHSRFLIWQIKKIERLTNFINKWKKGESAITFPRLFTGISTGKPFNTSLFMTALLGGGLRLIPVVKDPVPATTGWFYALQNIKQFRLQNLSSLLPEPFGFYGLLSFTSQVTQIQPELLLHLVESLTVFILCFFIYQIVQWAARTDRRISHIAGLLAVIVYAVAPILVMHNAFDPGLYYSKATLAISFAIPCVYSFYYISAKFSYRLLFSLSLLAVASIDLFIFVYILLPLLAVVCTYFLVVAGWQKSIGKAGMLIGATAAVITIYATLISYYGLSYRSFLLWQFFNPEIYNPGSRLSGIQLPLLWYGFWTGLGFILLNGILVLKGRKSRLLELFLFMVFCSMALLYHPSLNTGFSWVYNDQLLSFFSFITAVFYGLIALNVVRFVHDLSSKKMLSWTTIPVLLISITGATYVQYHFPRKTEVPPTLPSGFFESYYQIATTRIPYTYTVVGPEIMQSLSTNRNAFMSYSFFLNNFSRIDSRYAQKVETTDEPIREIKFEYRPSPSMFLFVAKAPYVFQHQMVVGGEDMMRRMHQWVREYRRKPGRTVELYYENEHCIIYELKYETGTSRINPELFRVQTNEPFPLFNE